MTKNDGGDAGETIDEARPEPMLWPDVPRICFGSGQPWALNACVGWVMSRRRDRLSDFASGYREAAERLYASVLEGRGAIDVLVFPIAFLWRHHVEIALKDIISKGRELAGDAPDFPQHHDVLKLWSVARPFVEETGPKDGPEVDNVESNIRELDRIDPGSFGFRYPTNRDDSDSLPGDLTHVNLCDLHEGMEAVSNFLHGVASVLDERQRYAWEAMADQRDYYDE